MVFGRACAELPAVNPFYKVFQEAVRSQPVTVFVWFRHPRRYRLANGHRQTSHCQLWTWRSRPGASAERACLRARSGRSYEGDCARDRAVVPLRIQTSGAILDCWGVTHEGARPQLRTVCYSAGSLVVTAAGKDVLFRPDNQRLNLSR
jgi:hypothetical protein